jgi:hypothetical protein
VRLVGAPGSIAQTWNGAYEPTGPAAERLSYRRIGKPGYWLRSVNDRWIVSDVSTAKAGDGIGLASCVDTGVPLPEQCKAWRLTASPGLAAAPSQLLVRVSRHLSAGPWLESDCVA